MPSGRPGQPERQGAHKGRPYDVSGNDDETARLTFQDVCDIISTIVELFGPMTTTMPITTPPSTPPALGDGDDAIAGCLAALGQPHRLRIFRLLLESELCVCELEGRLRLSSSLLAHHLRRLRESGLIRVRRGVRDARWLYYSVNPPAFALLQSFLSDMSGRRELPPGARRGSSCACG